MRWAGAFLGLLAALAPAEDLDGTITAGKAKQLVEAALPLYREADAVYKAWILDEIEEHEVVPELKRAIALYDEATEKLSEALEIRYDASVNHLIRLAARKMTAMRFRTEFRRAPRPPPAATGPKPEAEPEPEPEPEPPPPPDEEEPPAPAVRFAADAPPATPRDVELPRTLIPEGNAEYDRIVERDRRAIAQLLKGYYHARKASKLLFRHRICRGKGCDECAGTGRLINLHFFRKAYWTSFTPSLRDAPGALEALREFRARAQGDVAAFGPMVKSFKILEIDHRGYWARARVLENTDEGKEERTVTLISVGRSWFFFHPDTDRELLPRWGRE